MRAIVSVIFAAAFFSAAAGAFAGPAVPGVHWRSIGPATSGGRLGAVAGTDADPALYYAGAADGGVWKSTDAGFTWTPVFDGENVAAVGALAIDPSDENRVWAGTGEANPRNDVTQGDGVYLTRDGGKTWKNVLPIRNSTVSAIIVDPRNGKHVVVGVLGDPFGDSEQRGVYVTDDGGATWNKTLYLSPASGVSDLVANPANPNELLAGMWHFRRMPWGFVSGGSDDGLYASQDGGATWKKLQGNGLPEGTLGRIGLSYARSAPGRIYALIENKNGLLYRSDDGGKTWIPKSTDRLIDERPFYFSHIFVDPLDADRVMTVSVHLTLSEDGGNTFSIVGRGVHGDHHTMWLSKDGTRIIEGNDGGLAFSFTHGKTWQSRPVLPISQAYHVSVSREPLYRVCLPLQDVGIFCAPSNPRASTINASNWLFMTGGDGTSALIDPRDPDVIWQAVAGGNSAGDIIGINTRSNRSFDVSPYARDINVVDPKDLKYRFNWETPIAFDPFNSSRLFTGGNVVFETTDNGVHWTIVSPDLTRNDRSHQRILGGLTPDGTGAETSDTILALAPSSVHRGELWVGTDDGLIQLTRNSGASWKNVTPPGIAPWGRFASISPSSKDAATAYAIYDRHMLGDRTPYVFATHDYGAHWKNIAAGLRSDDEARSILADPNVPGMLFLGTERGIYASWDDGSSWSSIAGDMPPVSVHDIRYQPDAHDLVVATHGRGGYIYDDVTSLERLRASELTLFSVRDAVMYNTHDYYRGHRDGEAPDFGALIAYFLPSGTSGKPAAQIVDSRGRVVRDLGTLDGGEGLHHTAWDFTGETPPGWRFAPRWNRDYSSGVSVVPGTYRVRMTLAGRTMEKSFRVLQDPATHFTIAQLSQHRDETARVLADLGSLDRTLDRLSTVEQEALLRMHKVPAGSALASRLQQTHDQTRVLIATMTSDPKNDQDNDFLQDKLRERLQTQLDNLNTNYAPVTAEQIREDRDLHAATLGRNEAAQAFLSKLAALDGELRAMQLPALDVLTVQPQPRGDGQTGRRRADDND